MVINRINENKIRIRYEVELLYQEGTTQSLIGYKKISLTLRNPLKYDSSKSYTKICDYTYFKPFTKFIRTLSNIYSLSMNNINPQIDTIHACFEDKMIIIATPIAINFSGKEAKKCVRKLKIKKLLSESEIV